VDRRSAHAEFRRARARVIHHLERLPGARQPRGLDDVLEAHLDPPLGRGHIASSYQAGVRIPPRDRRVIILARAATEPALGAPDSDVQVPGVASEEYNGVPRHEPLAVDERAPTRGEQVPARRAAVDVPELPGRAVHVPGHDGLHGRVGRIV
jgi:hypothetical protein